MNHSRILNTLIRKRYFICTADLNVYCCKFPNTCSPANKLHCDIQTSTVAHSHGIHHANLL